MTAGSMSGDWNPCTGRTTAQLGARHLRVAAVVTFAHGLALGLLLQTRLPEPPRSITIPPPVPVEVFWVTPAARTTATAARSAPQAPVHAGSTAATTASAATSGPSIARAPLAVPAQPRSEPMPVPPKLMPDRQPATASPVAAPIEPSTQPPLSEPPHTAAAAIADHPAAGAAAPMAQAAAVGSTAGKPGEAPAGPGVLRGSGATTEGPDESGATLPDSMVGYLQRPRPHYPPLSRRLGESGRVGLRVQIDIAGRPVAVAVVASSGHPRLDDAAAQAARRALFRPYVESGQPRSVWVSLAIVFTFDES